MKRRALITGLVSLIAAPAIVKASALMQIKGDHYFFWHWRSPILPNIGLGIEAINWKNYVGPNGGYYEGTWTFFGKDHNIYSDEQIAFSKCEIPRLAA